jgi:butyrate kinase
LLKSGVTIFLDRRVFMSEYILAINPGSTSSKIALYDGLKEIFTETVYHNADELKGYNRIIDQLDLRLEYILKFLDEKEININDLKAVVGRGGLLKPIPGGTYEVNEAMIADLKSEKREEHASNLGGVLAQALADKADIPSFIVDPVVVDELEPLARISGLPELERRSIFHALNQKAVARKYAEDTSRKYEDLNIIVAHLGGGISVGLHHQGRVVDVNNALSGDGPFSPNRSGGLPAFNLAQMCFSDKYSSEEIRKKLIGNGGVIAYLGTNDMLDVEERVKNGDEEAKLVLDAMTYQIAKEIASLAPVVNGEIDAIILTGGIAYSEYVTAQIRDRVKFIANVELYPGEEEFYALVAGAYRVLKGEEKAKIYK